MAFYYMDGAQKIGPVDNKRFYELVADSVITAETHVWRMGWDDWHLASSPCVTISGNRVVVKPSLPK